MDNNGKGVTNKNRLTMILVPAVQNEVWIRARWEAMKKGISLSQYVLWLLTEEQKRIDSLSK